MAEGVERVSSYILCKRLEGQLQAKFSGLDLLSFSGEEQKAIQALRQAIIDARLTIRDYEVADTRAEQLQAIQEATAFLEEVRKGILLVSAYDIFNPADVAHLGANVEQIIDHLE